MIQDTDHCRSLISKVPHCPQKGMFWDSLEAVAQEQGVSWRLGSSDPGYLPRVEVSRPAPLSGRNTGSLPSGQTDERKGLVGASQVPVS